MSTPNILGDEEYSSATVSDSTQAKHDQLDRTFQLHELQGQCIGRKYETAILSNNTVTARDDVGIDEMWSALNNGYEAQTGI